jgi:hypothetical protein
MPAYRGSLTHDPAPTSKVEPQLAWFQWEITDFVYQTQLFKMTVETASHWGLSITSTMPGQTDLSPEAAEISTPGAPSIGTLRDA